MMQRDTQFIPTLAPLVFALAWLGGCGAAGPAQTEERPTAGRSLEANVELDGDTARLARFWAIDRFALDAHRPVQVRPVLDGPKVLAHARPDEVFDGQPKTNDAYVWGLVMAGPNLWFGTVANTLCYAQQDIIGVGLNLPVEDFQGYFYCGFDRVDGHYGDWRAPNLFRYDTGKRKLFDVNPASGTPEDALRRQAIGFRSAGESRDVVFLAGPGLTGNDPEHPEFDGGIVVFAYDARSSKLLGARKLAEYNNVRSWLRVGDDLYVGVGLTHPQVVSGTEYHGAVLRWTGSSLDPFRFEVVGWLETEAANLALHAGRIYVTTWPFFQATSLAGMHPMGLFRSPVIPGGGLSSAHAGQWAKVWSILQYDRDPISAIATGGGALASVDGRLTWGTMHVPFAGTAMALEFFGIRPDTIDAALVERLANLALGTHRSASVFQGRESGASRFDVTLLYGEKYLPRAVYPPVGDGVYRIAATADYATGYTPRFGASGLGNFFNAYIWSATVFDEQVWLGTFDWSQVARGALQGILVGEGLLDPAQLQKAELLRRAADGMLARLGNIVPHEGADLYRFPATSGPAVAEDLTGLGNDVNYGFRTFAPTRDRLYVGTANAMNMNPDGGWELLMLWR